MSASLLTQSIPDFEESTVAFPLTLIFTVIGFASCFSLDITEGAVLFLQERWATGCLVGYRQPDGRLLFAFARAQDYFGSSPQQLWGEMTPERILAALWQGSLAIPQHYLSDGLQPESRSGAAAGCSRGQQAARKQVWAVRPAAVV